ncbi:MAG TPA: hypothetical protein VFR37_04810 [Longimicrobium sp.]|nr:hypothetical protein [Longimicrobium sp.]
MSPRTRHGAAQAGFPEQRAPWLFAAILLTVVVASIVMVRGPYGRPITPFGAIVRTLGLLLLAAVPPIAMAWAWKRLPRWGRRIAPIPIGVLTVLLALLAMAHLDIYWERVRMGRDPARLAAAAFARRDTRFWAVEDSLNDIHAPPIVNRCLINRYGFHLLPGTGGMMVNPAHRRYRTREYLRARQYNQTMIARLRIPPDEVRRIAPAYCPD